CPVWKEVEKGIECLVGKHLSTIIYHFVRPRHCSIFHDRFCHKKSPAEAQGLPPLGQGAAGVGSLDDDAAVREEGRGAITQREIAALNGRARWELRETEVLTHNLVLQTGIRLGMDLV